MLDHLDLEVAGEAPLNEVPVADDGLDARGRGGQSAGGDGAGRDGLDAVHVARVQVEADLGELSHARVRDAHLAKSGGVQAVERDARNVVVLDDAVG